MLTYLLDAEVVKNVITSEPVSAESGRLSGLRTDYVFPT